ncbi:hypothetical protein OUZ56_013694 [Daphnia magna]|uniref:Uncharacterized protein n=1 Tax=Daphnia magna TaxID=35525 RepID=A0ABQ9Z6M6_9CRUS|nr:hypothetical protein OUZ56_013694 [Daphnia magna]
MPLDIFEREKKYCFYDPSLCPLMASEITKTHSSLQLFIVTNTSCRRRILNNDSTLSWCRSAVGHFRNKECTDWNGNDSK